MDCGHGIAKLNRTYNGIGVTPGMKGHQSLVSLFLFTFALAMTACTSAPSYSKTEYLASNNLGEPRLTVIDNMEYAIDGAQLELSTETRMRQLAGFQIRPDGKHVTINSQGASSSLNDSCIYAITRDVSESDLIDLSGSLEGINGSMLSPTSASCANISQMEFSGYENAALFLDGLHALFEMPEGAYAKLQRSDEIIVSDKVRAEVNAERAQAKRHAEEQQRDAIVQEYREAKVKPALSGDARMYAVQAADAYAHQRTDDAIQLYEKCLDLAYWWPDGHYNLALLLGSQGNYAGAIREMQVYLQLGPNSPDAQKAQDQIWVWQGRENQAN